MINAVTSSLDSFKEVRFNGDFSVVLAERTAGASERDSRNGSGKTSLLEIIHFCLGSDFSRSSLRVDALQGVTFSLDCAFRGRSLTVTRSTEEPGRVQLEGSVADWPLEVRIDDDGNQYLRLAEWKRALGWLAFGLPPESADETFTPTSRGLFSYFLRRGRDAFSDPFAYFRNQPSWDKQVLVAALLGLDWQFPRRAELLRIREDRMTTALRAIEQVQEDRRERTADRLTEGSLEARRINLTRRIRDVTEQLASFNVHPQYRDLEAQADRLTSDIHRLINENVTDRQLVDRYLASVTEEIPADQEALAAMYQEAGIYFEQQLAERLDAVLSFHERIVQNRRGYLEAETNRIAAEIERREAEIETLSRQRSEHLNFLREHGALDEYLALQRAHQADVEALAELEAQLNQVAQLEQEQSELRVERAEHEIAGREDFRERREIWSRAVELFGEHTAELYERPGRLILDVASGGGLRFSYEIERQASQGVQEMMVFCFDLMLARLWSEREATPGVLIHDSTIFDGVDERQVARALQMAARASREHGFQYVCAMNSDSIPWNEFDEGFDFRRSVVLELTDEGESGGLFGIRFG